MHIRRPYTMHTVIYDRIRQSFISVYGAEAFICKSLRIFARPPYTESVSGRFTSYTLIVHGSRLRLAYIPVFIRKRSFTTVHVRPGQVLQSFYFFIKINTVKLSTPFIGSFSTLRFWVMSNNLEKKSRKKNLEEKI